MRNLKIIFATIILGLMASCSEDSMDIPSTPATTYYVKVVKRTEVFKITYTDASKTTEAQRLRNTADSSSKTIYEKTGASHSEMQRVRERYENAREVEITDQGTIVNYEWNISYFLTINKL